MPILKLTGLCLLSAVLATPLLGAQERQQIIINGPGADFPGPLPGMAPRPVKTGTSRIRGRVIASDTGSAVRRAQVRLNGADIGSRSAMTDGEGRFEFRELPAGRFTMSAIKSGYVSVQFGQTRPFESGKPIELAEGQLLDKADIQMPRGSVIAGRVLDEFGEPVTDSMVSAVRSVWTGGRRRMQPSGRTAMTNDLGQFRLYGLPPGEYYVSATLRDSSVMEMNLPLPMGGTPSRDPAPASGYAPTYFPGTSNAADAQKITVAPGQDAQSTDFALVPVRLARITGVVLNSEGKPVEGSMINAVPHGGDMGFLMMNGSARTGRDGRFTLNGLPPGDYLLQSRVLQIMTSGSGDMMTFSATMGGEGGGETGSLPVSVSGEDLSNVVIMTSKGATASGEVTFEGGTKPPAFTTLRITPPSASPDGFTMGGAPAAVKPDGGFELRGLSGVRLIRPIGLPPGWMLKAVRVNGADVTDTGIDFKPGEAVTGVEVVLTSKVTDLSGTVTTSSGAAVTDYTVVVFSDDPQRWTLPNSRYVAGARPDQDGRFRVRDLPPGEYYAIAEDYIAQGEWGDPDVLDRLKAQATRFTLAEGESRTLELKMK